MSRIVVVAAVVCLFVGSYLAKAYLAPPFRGENGDWAPPKRIISTAPSITETLFALRLGDRVVGVTKFCNYPTETADLPRIGGYSNPNYEAIVALQPDLVVMLETVDRSVTAFDKLRLDTLEIDHTRIEGIFESMRMIGRACQEERTAETMVQDIQHRLDRVARKTEGRKRPRVLFVIGRANLDNLASVSIAGNDGHLDRILELAGSRNAYSGSIRFPDISQEGILHLNPEVILELVMGWARGTNTPEQLRADWQTMSKIDAVRNDRVIILDDDYAMIPGPRFILLVEKLARRIHPEVDWDE